MVYFFRHTIISLLINSTAQPVRIQATKPNNNTFPDTTQSETRNVNAILMF